MPSEEHEGSDQHEGRDTGVLRAWLYDVDQQGRSVPMWQDAAVSAKAGPPGAGQSRAVPWLTVPCGAVLRVSVDGGRNSKTWRHLRVPPAEGMASEPVTVGLDAESRHWMIRNSGRTNTLRVQQYGLSAVPLRPGAAMPMGSDDVTVWIPVVPSGPRTWPAEAFRLLVLSARTPGEAGAARQSATGQPGTGQPVPGTTAMITAPRRFLSPAMQEALVAYFGEHLSWPPLPAPHVRQQKEVGEIAVRAGLPKRPSPQHWARNRHDVLAGRDGLFTVADWYPRLGGPGRSLANHLAAFSRLVELGSITLPRMLRWAAEHDVRPYVIVDKLLDDAS